MGTISAIPRPSRPSGGRGTPRRIWPLNPRKSYMDRGFSAPQKHSVMAQTVAFGGHTPQPSWGDPWEQFRPHPGLLGRPDPEHHHIIFSLLSWDLWYFELPKNVTFLIACISSFFEVFSHFLLNPMMGKGPRKVISQHQGSNPSLSLCAKPIKSET